MFRKSYLCNVIQSCIFLLAFCVLHVAAFAEDYAPGRLIVRFEEKTTLSEAGEVIDDTDFKVTKPCSTL